MPFNIVIAPKGKNRDSLLSIWSRRVIGCSKTYEEAELFISRFYSEKPGVEIWMQVKDNCIPIALKG